MGVGLIVAVAVVIWILLLGIKTFAVFGLVVSCANFCFPFGMIAMVAVGAALLFLLAPRHSIK